MSDFNLNLNKTVSSFHQRYFRLVQLVWLLQLNGPIELVGLIGPGEPVGFVGLVRLVGSRIDIK